LRNTLTCPGAWARIILRPYILGAELRFACARRNGRRSTPSTSLLRRIPATLGRDGYWIALAAQHIDFWASPPVGSSSARSFRWKRSASRSAQFVELRSNHVPGSAWARVISGCEGPFIARLPVRSDRSGAQVSTCMVGRNESAKDLREAS